MIKSTKTPILPNCQVPNGVFGITVNLSLQILKNKHLVCLNFWDVSSDSRAKIYLSMENMWKIFSLVPSKNPLTRETDAIKNWATLHNFCYWTLRFTKTPFGTWQFGKIGPFAKFNILKLKFYEITQLFIVSVSLVRDFWGNERKYFPHILGLKEEKNFFETTCFIVYFFINRFIGQWIYFGSIVAISTSMQFFFQNVLFLQI